MNPVRFLPLEEASKYFGFQTGGAMLKAFKRGHLNKEYLLRVGPRSLRVDCTGLEKWILEQGKAR